MNNVIFYKTRSGKQPVFDYMEELSLKKDKDSRIKLHNIQDDILELKTYGKYAGEPTMKHLDGEIWELRPGHYRILFTEWVTNKFVLLHGFIKKTQKTPKREIDKAKLELADFLERINADER